METQLTEWHPSELESLFPQCLACRAVSAGTCNQEPEASTGQYRAWESCGCLGASPEPSREAKEKCCLVGSALPPKASPALSVRPSGEGWVEGPEPSHRHGHSKHKSPGTKACGTVPIGRPGGARPSPGRLWDQSQPETLGSQTLPAPCILGWGVAVGGGSAFLLPACSQTRPPPHAHRTLGHGDPGPNLVVALTLCDLCVTKALIDKAPT